MKSGPGERSLTLKIERDPEVTDMKTRFYKTTFCFVLAGLLWAGSGPAAVTGKRADEPQEADVGTIYRQGAGVDEQVVRDMQAQGAIYEKLLDDSDVDPRRIHVTVENGRVVLTGEVDDEESRESVSRLAEETAYVTSVTNELRIADNGS